MKADAKFSRYSEREWGAIDAEVARASPHIDKIDLRARLEQFGRDYVSAPRLDPSQLKFLAAKEKQVAEFRRRVIEAGQLPPDLQQRAANLVGEIASIPGPCHPALSRSRSRCANHEHRGRTELFSHQL